MIQISVKDDALLEKARRISVIKKSDGDLVEAALREYVERRENHPLIQLFGQVDFDEHWDYKELRKRDQKRAIQEEDEQ